MNILVYGGGAVGLGLAQSLIRAGCGVTIIDVEPTVSALREKGIVQTGVLGQFTIKPEQFTVYDWLENIPSADFDYICVCIKSYMSQTIAQLLKKYEKKISRCPIILFQNGWGNAEKFIQYFDKEIIFNARVMTGYIKPALHHVDITVHADSIHIGSLYNGDVNQLTALAEALSKGGMPAEVTEEVAKDIWAKMLYNCALNPLGAIFNVPYGDLGKSEHTKAIMNDIFYEIFETMHKAGYTTHYKSADEYIEVFYSKLLPTTGEHRSSMLQDIQAKRKTEIDALNGAVVELAKQHGIKTPVNEVVTSLIKFIENKYM
ncbi:MAG: 2-dehydropantoate 2-reductase [Spirochaetes bacterium]|nr:2-dehydropantoate 2-reductase [Spirochaetota bacterium]